MADNGEVVKASCKPSSAATKTDAVDVRIAELSAELRAAHTKLSLFASSSLMGQVVHRGGILLDANDRFLEMTGYRREELVGEAVVDIVIDVESRELIGQRIQLGLEGKYFVMGLHRDGRRFPIELEVRRGIFEGEDARVVTLRDISERAPDLAQLQALERQLFQLLELSFDGVVSVEQGLVSFACGSALRLLERSREVLLGSQWAELLGPALEDSCTSATPAPSLPPSSGSRSGTNGGMVRVTRHHRGLVLPDGRLLPTECAEFPAVIGGRDVQMWGLRRWAISNVAQSSTTAAARKQQWDEQKGDTVALVAAGLSHDLNNLLVGVLGNAELAEAALLGGEDIRGYIQAIRVAAERASELATRMMHYASDNEMKARPMQLITLVDETISLARSGVSKAVRVMKVVNAGTESSSLMVNGDAGRLGQVILNLIMNGVDALGPGGGTVRVELDECSGIPEDAIERPADSTARFVRLSVRDDGSGMDPATVRNAFEPFFSTKRDGRGLGLATSLAIVRRHHGGLAVTSRLGQGTCIDVYLPQANSSGVYSGDGVPSTPPPEVSWKAHGRVLVIDDEQLVARLTGMVLEHFGFLPTIEQSGSAGLNRLKEAMSAEEGEAFRLVLVDFTMPDMSGNDVADEIKQLAPTLPVVLTSGFSYREVQSRGMSPAFSGFLQKPYRMARMVDVLKAALASDEE